MLACSTWRNVVLCGLVWLSHGPSCHRIGAFRSKCDCFERCCGLFYVPSRITLWLELLPFCTASNQSHPYESTHLSVSMQIHQLRMPQAAGTSRFVQLFKMTFSCHTASLLSIHVLSVIMMRWAVLNVIMMRWAEKSKKVTLSETQIQHAEVSDDLSNLKELHI